MFDFTLPLSQKAITWKPLTIGQQLDARAAHKDNGSLVLDMLARRILTFDGKPGITLGQIREWDTIDFNAFTDHVDSSEADRAAKFQKPMLAGDAILLLEQAQNSLEENIKTVREVISNAIATLRQSGSAGPLK